MLSLNMNIENTAVTVLFDWYGEEPDWEGMEVIALLPTPDPSLAKYWVTINDVLSDEQWRHIEMEIYAQWKELERQAYEQEY